MSNVLTRSKSMGRTEQSSCQSSRCPKAVSSADESSPEDMDWEPTSQDETQSTQEWSPQCAQDDDECILWKGAPAGSLMRSDTMWSWGPGNEFKVQPDVRFLAFLAAYLQYQGIPLSFLEEIFVTLGLDDLDENLYNYIEHYVPDNFCSTINDNE